MDKKTWKNIGENALHLFFIAGIVTGIVVTLVFSRVVQPNTVNPEGIANLMGPIKYNCELSNGTFKNGMCSCPIESFQTQEEMYDKTTGFCQTTFGGAGGDALYASIGLPYGSYNHWNEIIAGLCEQSGGGVSGAACLCPTEKVYDKTTGQCKLSKVLSEPKLMF